ncbi:MAG: GNAT family N-acetyltransferase [Candidatus Aenigmarchaeota archaeon]|nr:GNAT family N-acetyltransferase [Candidatus Aenigmarchaeota archaeon]
MIKIIVNGIELDLEEREIILPGHGPVLIKALTKDVAENVVDPILNSMKRSQHQEQISSHMIDQLRQWFDGNDAYFFIVGEDPENNTLLGITSGYVSPFHGEIYGSGKLILNTSGVRGIGEKLLKIRADTYFSSEKINVLYDIPLDKSENSKVKRIFEKFGYDQESRGEFYRMMELKMFPHRPYTLSRENYKKAISKLI